MKSLISSLCIIAFTAGSSGLSAGIYTDDFSIPADDPSIVGWATGYQNLNRGYMDISTPSAGTVGYGDPNDMLGKADAHSSSNFNVVSLGDGGSVTLTFANPITNGTGYDFAVFENGFSETFLELGFVEVSSDGINFFRFESDYAPEEASPVQIGGFGSVDTTEYYNLAGKYMSGWGTMFDLEEFAGTAGLDTTRITHVRIIDVVGSLDPAYGSQDADGDYINDPFSTPFNTGGFDLDAVGVIHAIPEPSTWVLICLSAGTVVYYARKK
ncbi:PEP-CTERM sorting domain-containing protein [Kiritimatiellaeota bacterium B1221]|nr:PEP-CTERM sorting domain-containing protein [Kiritimatiellaeota bacterium B1221]